MKLSNLCIAGEEVDFDSLQALSEAATDTNNEMELLVGEYNTLTLQMSTLAGVQEAINESGFSDSIPKMCGVLGGLEHIDINEPFGAGLTNAKINIQTESFVAAIGAVLKKLLYAIKSSVAMMFKYFTASNRVLNKEVVRFSKMRNPRWADQVTPFQANPLQFFNNVSGCDHCKRLVEGMHNLDILKQVEVVLKKLMSHKWNADGLGRFSHYSLIDFEVVKEQYDTKAPIIDAKGVTTLPSNIAVVITKCASRVSSTTVKLGLIDKQLGKIKPEKITVPESDVDTDLQPDRALINTQKIVSGLNWLMTKEIEFAVKTLRNIVAA